MEDSNQAPVVREDVQLVGSAQELGALFLALAKAQGEFLPLGKEATASVKNKEGKWLYDFDYCPLDAVIAATQPALTKYELCFMQLTNGNDLLTILAHGPARIESRIGLLEWQTPQQLGAMLTYFKRYTRLGMLGVFPAGEDDDGNAASGNQASVKPRQANLPPATASKPSEPVKGDPGALTPQTKSKIGELSRALKLTRKELEDLSVELGCGKLDDLNEAKGGALLKVLADKVNSPGEVQS